MASRINTVVADLRNGLGAIKLRPDIKKVTLMFSRRSDNAGARYNIYYQQSLMSGKHGQDKAEQEASALCSTEALQILTLALNAQGLRSRQTETAGLDWITRSYPRI